MIATSASDVNALLLRVCLWEDITLPSVLSSVPLRPNDPSPNVLLRYNVGYDVNSASNEFKGTEL